MDFRPWTPADTAACLAIFHSNHPQFFADHEEAEFLAFLDQQEGPYFVVTTTDNRLVASGGFVVEPARGCATLAWGMVDRAYHRTGIGRFLLLKRLERMLQDPWITTIELDTTQHSADFFAKFGFTIQQVTPHGYAPGMNRVDMRLLVDPARRVGLMRQLAPEQE